MGCRKRGDSIPQEGQRKAIEIERDRQRERERTETTTDNYLVI